IANLAQLPIGIGMIARFIALLNINAAGNYMKEVGNDTTNDKALIVISEKTTHPTTIVEIVSTKDLRSTFNLKEGDEFIIYPLKKIET
ncbi:MAG: DUF120 domain-containing protein, partial [Candidatus Woesearchaeota archaeon]